MMINILLLLLVFIIIFFKYINTKKNLNLELENIKKENTKYCNENDMIRKQYLLKEEKLENKKEEFENKKEKLYDEIEKEKKYINEEKEKNLDEKERLIAEKEIIQLQFQQINTKKEEMEVEYNEKLYELAKMNEEEAKEFILNEVEKTAKEDTNKKLKKYEDYLELEKEKLSREILLDVIENIATDTTNENVLTNIKIESDELKGKIIGRDGRNIKALENELGVNILVDSTPGSFNISTFNPIRRAIATATLNALVTKGVINQGTIETYAQRSRDQIERIILEKGKEAVYKFNIQDMDINLIKEIGKLNFRSSYGQNMLLHSMECAYIAKMIAGKFNLDQELAARCALLHDIGKIDSEETGISHVQLGVKITRKYNESDIVINSIEAHHGDVETSSIYAVITKIADQISAGREGVRRESYQDYIERVTKLEEIALREEGVNKAYALQGGKEIRIIVQPQKILDDNLHYLAMKVKKRIEKELTFPGVIKINVIRERKYSLNASKKNKIEEKNGQ